MLAVCEILLNRSIDAVAVRYIEVYEVVLVEWVSQCLEVVERRRIDIQGY